MQNTTLNQLTQTVLDLATQKGVKLIVAESCTGGMVAATLTDPAGASAAFWGGFVVYANDMKQHLLGVDAALLEKCGAVSPEVAQAMAKGAVDHSPATLAVSVSGIAGPGGGSAQKPVGLVEFATFLKGDKTAAADTQIFKGNRAKIREHATYHALTLLKQRLERI